MPPHLPQITEQLLYDEGKNEIRNHHINQDGWGLGWYEKLKDGGLSPRRIRSSNGATSFTFNSSSVTIDPGLERVIQQGENISSRIMFAHIRASTDGAVSKENSHPFAFGRLFWMHNGGVHDKVALVDNLTDLDCFELKKLVTGNTDTEYAGALYSSFLESDVCRQADFTMAELRSAMERTVKVLSNGGQGSSLNFAVSDGVRVVAARYRSLLIDEPPSLYYSFDGSSLWVSSEPLDKEECTDECGDAQDREWVLLAKDQMVMFDTSTNDFSMACLTKACGEELEFRSK